MENILRDDAGNILPITLIGEYTTAAGPFADDYFLVVVHTSNYITEYPIPCSAKLIRTLEEITGEKIEFRLANFPNEASRIMFPLVLAERPLFEFHSPKLDLAGIFRLIRSFGVTITTKQLTSEAAKYVESNQSSV